MKIFAILKVMFISFFFITNCYASQVPEDEPGSHSTTPRLQEMSQITDLPSQLLEMRIPTSERPQTAQLSLRGRDYVPFLKSLCINENLDKAVESCKFLEKMLSDEEIAQADMEAASPNAQLKNGMYDWVTAGWGLAQWIVGTSRNFSYLTIVTCAALANVFPRNAVTFATASGVAAGFGAFLPKTHQYCKEKKLKRMAYNMVVMSGQLEKRAKALQFVQRLKLNATSSLSESSSSDMEMGRSTSSASSSTSTPNLTHSDDQTSSNQTSS